MKNYLKIANLTENEMTKLFILNGPAGVGKDTIADIMVEIGVAKEKVSFKSPMFNVARGILSMDEFGWFIENYNNRDEKEKHQKILGGKSIREFMIWISESVMKPVFGDDIFGKRLAQSLGDGCYICADGGFASEIKPLIDAGVEVTLIRLHRAGYTFDGDSRSYIHGVCAREIDVRVVDCDIDGTSALVRHVINSTNC